MNTADTSLNGRVALVTGGGSGIGAAIARGLAAHGATVAVTGRTLKSLQDTVATIEAAGGRARAYAMDVADAAACADVAQRMQAELGDTSLVVNNAGVIHYAGVDSPQVMQAWKESMDINLSGPFNVIMAWLPQLKATRGAVVNMGSIASYIYTANTPGYSASKGGVRLLTVAMARELGPHGVRVNGIAPGAIRTPMSPSASDPERMAALCRRVPLQRIGEPEDLIGPVVFLASDMAAYITGTTLVVDGGYLTA
ncbi:glucose 1-dehydrogenase [Hydrogenophaga sp.]|uniref:SDR family NAD(P)-dependent oxidoreductase n=1 Tax=Hydrogenophaga sp. TaxID=1904254 RepID=UPI00261CE492|nr:glucose 1-dehydrogenase [Hydrogenophaga sp.]MCW5653327.1 glucose 1-dehydrogenase [Hydrogenophaga sp.]